MRSKILMSVKEDNAEVESIYVKENEEDKEKGPICIPAVI